jgi:hypothetical protein
MISFASRNCSKPSVSQGWRHEIIADLGSGLKYKKKGLQRLLELILFKRTHRLVLTHKDRLLRFGSELIFALCEIQNIEIVIINQGEPPSFEEELAQDVIEIITVFGARLCGSRSHKTKQLLADLREEESKEEEVVTKSMPIPEGRVGALIESMQETQFKAMLLYAELLKKRKRRRCCWLIKSRSTRMRSSGSTLSARRVPRASPGIGRWPNGSVNTRPVSVRLKSHCVGS